MSCADCGTEERTLLYRSGRMGRCYDCQGYVNLKVKSKGTLPYDRETFVEWKRAAESRRRCGYCGIDSAGLYALQVINVRTKKAYESIGVDRIDNARGYELDNIRPCCGPCNAIRGSILTAAEMDVLGPALAELWRRRGA